jgi:hypothetical protein
MVTPPSLNRKTDNRKMVLDPHMARRTPGGGHRVGGLSDLEFEAVGVVRGGLDIERLGAV